jgi:hypothetical protein
MRTTLPTLLESGLYRLRRAGGTETDYIGQTGLPLVRRLGMLSGAYAEEMPYRDPHVAAPGLWALRHLSGCEFEASVVALAGTAPERKAAEAVAITAYRRTHGVSPTLNFGRFPAGYRVSSGNNARLVAAKARRRGGPDPEAIKPSASAPPLDPLSGDPTDDSWAGLQWSAWVRAIAAPGPDVARGFYRLRQVGEHQLVYVGQGQLRARVRQHLRRASAGDHPQAAAFGDAERLEVSWVRHAGVISQLLELENDLIAAHVNEVGTAPAAQFRG